MALRQNPEVSRFHHWSPADELEVHWFIHCFSDSFRIVPGEWKQLGVFRREDNAIVGDCGFRVNDDGEAEISYTVAPEFRRRGFASEAVSALVDSLLSRPKITCAIARITPDNLPSAGLLAKLGFARDPNLSKTITTNGRTIPVLVFRREATSG